MTTSSRLARSALRTQSDERLTALTRHGSDAAFEAIIARYRRSLVRHCTRVVGEIEAEEAVQDALLRAHAALTGGDDVRNVRAWLHAIAHNAALNVLRARATRPECLPAVDEPADPENHTPEQREELREVLTAVAELPARQRDAIVMRELEGRSYDEIAARLGTSRGAVRQLLSRARHAMRARLGALTGIEPLLRYVVSTGDGGTIARLGAVTGGCALTAKICTAALAPAVAGGVGGIATAVTPAHAAVSPARAARPAARPRAALVHRAVRVERHALVVTSRPAVAPRVSTPRGSTARTEVWHSSSTPRNQNANVRPERPPERRPSMPERRPSRPERRTSTPEPAAHDPIAVTASLAPSQQAPPEPNTVPRDHAAERSSSP